MPPSAGHHVEFYITLSTSTAALTPRLVHSRVDSLPYPLFDSVKETELAAREGLEPSTYGLTVRRSTDWTNGPGKGAAIYWAASPVFVVGIFIDGCSYTSYGAAPGIRTPPLTIISRRH